MILKKRCKEGEKPLGWNWYNYIIYVKLPISTIIYAIIFVVFLMQIFTTPNIIILIFTSIFMFMLMAHLVTIYGFYGKKNMQYIYILL